MWKNRSGRNPTPFRITSILPDRIAVGEPWSASSRRHWRSSPRVAWRRGRIWREARVRFDEALDERDFDGISLTGILEPLVQLVLQSHREDARQRRSLDIRPGSPEQGAGMRGFHAHILSRIRPLLLARDREILHPIPERAVDVGFAAVVGAIRVLEEGTLEEGARAGLTDESVVAELARLYRSYLGGGRPDGEAPPQMEFFDIWE